eukprot:856210_1
MASQSGFVISDRTRAQLRSEITEKLKECKDARQVCGSVRGEVDELVTEIVEKDLADVSKSSVNPGDELCSDPADSVPVPPLCRRGHVTERLSHTLPREYIGSVNCCGCGAKDLHREPCPGYFHCDLCEYDLCQDCASTTEKEMWKREKSELINTILDSKKIVGFVDAAAKNDFESIKYLLQLDTADVNTPDDDGWTALCRAASAGHLQIVRTLLRQPGIDANAGPTPPLILAAEEGRHEVVSRLLDHADVSVNSVCQNGRTALHCAGFHGHTGVVRTILSEPSANVNLVDKGGCTALLLAITKSKKSREAVRMLLNRQEIDVNRADAKQVSPLKVACILDRPEIVELFMGNQNLDVNAVDETGTTALMHASVKGFTFVVCKFLDNYKVDLHQTNNAGQTAATITENDGIRSIIEYNMKVRRENVVSILADIRRLPMDVVELAGKYYI